MTNFAELLGIVALGIANGFLYVFMDNWIVSRSDAIATGTFGGAGAPLKHRRYRLQTNLIINTGVLVFICGLLVAAWLMIGRHASDDVQLFAYLTAFVNGVGAVGWLAVLPLHYRHLASILRQAEAD